MGYKGILQILLILAIISTVCICIIKPEIHKPVMVYNSDFEVVTDNDTVKIEENNIPVLVQNKDIETNNSSNETNFTQVPVVINDNNNSKIINNSQDVKFNNVKNQPVSNINIKPKNAGIKTGKINTVKTNITPVNTKTEPQKITINEPKIDVNKIVSNNRKITNTDVHNEPAPVPVHQATPVKQPEPKQNINSNVNTKAEQSKPLSIAIENKPYVLSAQEEEIAWNKWRSNLNNQIMRDSKLPTMPNGIIFKYKFTVDKFGKVSNVQTWSTTSAYTPYAIQFIAPVIRNYQGHSILNFPAGSNRISTEVSGAWKISSNEKFSTPSDYNDFEKVKK